MNTTVRNLIGLASLLTLAACGGEHQDAGGLGNTGAGTGGGASGGGGTGKTVEECVAQFDSCFQQCVCVNGDAAQATCVSQCATAPTGTGTGPAPTGTGTGPAPTGTGTGPAPTGTGTGPAPTGTGTAPAPTGTGTAPAPTGTVPVEPPPTPTVQSLTLTTDQFDIPPGGDAYRCQNFTNPFGKDVDVITSESFMTAGSHHMFVFRQPGLTDGPVVECGGLEFSEYIHSAQTPQQLTTYPPGIGRYLPAGEGLRVQVHYVNTGSTTIKAQVTVKLDYVDTSQVTAHAAQIFLNNVAVRVPVGTSTATKTYTLPQDIKLLGGASHMHKRAIHFTATTTDGRPIYETNEWAEPTPAVFPDGLEIKAGSGITYACTYQNDTGMTLTFGESAATNEMCIFSGVFYPAPGGAGISAQQLF